MGEWGEDSGFAVWNEKKVIKTYRTGELAKMAGVHQATVWYAIRKGRLKTLNGVGGVWHRISHKEAMRWVEERKG